MKGGGSHGDYWWSVSIIWSILCVCVGYWERSIKADDRLEHIITSYLTHLVTNIWDLQFQSVLSSQLFSITEKSEFISGSPPLVNCNGLEMWEHSVHVLKCPNEKWQYKASLYLTRLHLNISLVDFNAEICAMMTPTRCKLYQLSEFS